MTKKEIMDLYDFNMQEAVEDYLCIGSRSDTYIHFRGVVYGLGFALGYRQGRITEELNNAIDEAKNNQIMKAI